jgi:hypothetical protein
VSEISSKRIEIAPIAVPQQFLAVGFTPEVMSRRLLDQITIIQTQSQTTMAWSGAGLVGDAVDFTLPGVGLSIATITQTARRLLAGC